MHNPYIFLPIMKFASSVIPGRISVASKAIAVSLGLLVLLPLESPGQDGSFPVTEYGHPDFRGVWNYSTATPLERPERYGNIEFMADAENLPVAQPAPRARQPRPNPVPSVGAYNSFWNDRNALQQNLRTSQIIYPLNGRIPPVQDGVQVQFGGDQTAYNPIPGVRPVRYTHGGISSDGPEDRGLSERCLVFNSGPPLLGGPYNNNIQIFQNRDHVVILVEMGFDARIVPIDGRAHIDEKVRLWSGDSRGYFEGNTLVVETRNFTNAVASFGLRGVAYGNGDNRLLIERFTRLDDQTLNYEFTIDDLTTFTDKIVAISPMTRVDDQIYEYACSAGNYGLMNIIRASRVAEADAASQ